MKFSPEEKRLILGRRRQIVLREKKDKKIAKLESVKQRKEARSRQVEEIAIKQIVAIILGALNSSRFNVDEMLVKVSEGVAKKDKVYQEEKEAQNIVRLDARRREFNEAERVREDRKELQYYKEHTEEGRRRSDMSPAD